MFTFHTVSVSLQNIQAFPKHCYSYELPGSELNENLHDTYSLLSFPSILTYYSHKAYSTQY